MHPDVYPQPIFGPSLIIAGRSAAWNGSTNNRLGEIGVSCRVLLEAKVKARVVSTLDVQNNGTAAIYYSWKVKSSGIYCHIDKFRASRNDFAVA